jgi:hypothetical protein
MVEQADPPAFAELPFCVGQAISSCCWSKALACVLPVRGVQVGLDDNPAITPLTIASTARHAVRRGVLAPRKICGQFRQTVGIRLFDCSRAAAFRPAPGGDPLPTNWDHRACGGCLAQSDESAKSDTVDRPQRTHSTTWLANDRERIPSRQESGEAMFCSSLACANASHRSKE